MTNTKYIVMSLPRTGTKSICKMAEICGLKQKHCPLTYNLPENYIFFADTPCFSQNFIESLCSNKNNIEYKFIYIEKEYLKIFESWERLGLLKNYNSWLSDEFEPVSIWQRIDSESYKNAFHNQKLSRDNCKEIFLRHKKECLDIIKKYNKELLIYKFDMGWSIFCDYIGYKNYPSIDIPTINKNTMFENI
jgi:hypothetical protein